MLGFTAFFFAGLMCLTVWSLQPNSLAHCPMSLKAFHLIFITLSSALALGCGVWLLVSGFSADGTRKDVFFGFSSLVGGAGLIFYGRYFLKKLKNISYL